MASDKVRQRELYMRISAHTEAEEEIASLATVHESRRCDQ